MSNAVREKIEAYFASLNPTSNRMMADIISSREKYLDKWDSLNAEEQSDILWQSIVKPEAVVKYKNLPSKNLEVEYFPVLKTKPGGKIIVEEDSASAKSFVSGSAYHDEHSAPFRWETQSQIDFRLQDYDVENENVRTLERDVSKSPDPEKQIAGSLMPIQDVPKSPKPERNIPESPKTERNVLNSPKLTRDVLKSPKLTRDVIKSPQPERNVLKSPKPERNVLKSPKPEQNVLKSPKPERNVLKSPKPERNVLKSPKPERNVLKSPKPDRSTMKSPKPEQNKIKSLTLDPNMLKSVKLNPSMRSPKQDRNTIKSPKSETVSNSPMLENISLKSADTDVLKSPRPDRHILKKDDDNKRSTIKRPEVPPPPVPPHFTPPVPPHIDAPVPPVPTHSAKTEKADMPIYAKVVKRKSANAKTLMISEMNIHRKAQEEMKPAVPPRMSLELKGNMDLMKYTAHTIDIDGIPKTGFDFLDNW